MDGMISRRCFLAGVAGALAGCSLPRAAASRGRFCGDYWSTSEAQSRAKGFGRDSLDEDALFGRGGWARLFPDVRRDLLLMLDGGGDVPCGAGYLAQLDGRIRDAGWRGTGIRVSAQMSGETAAARCDDWAMLAEDLKRRLGESAEGNIACWKVDGGVHGRDMRYLRLMSELRESYAPDLVIDNGWSVDNALNGRPYPKAGWRPPLLLDVMGSGICRMTDNPLYDGVRRDYMELMEFSDVVRIGDTLFPMCAATALDRAVFALECADRLGSHTVVGVGDECLIAAALGLEFAMTRAPSSGGSDDAGLPWSRGERMAEASRCVAWHRVAPPYGSDRGIRLRRGMDRLEETWSCPRNSRCWESVRGRELRQSAPAVVSRGLPLPEVRSMDPSGDVPFVVAGQNPNGAKSVAAVPLVTSDRGFHTPRASVTLDARLESGEPLGVFGEFGELTVTLAGRRPSRVLACDLAGGSPEDITSCAVYDGDRITLPGDALTRIGTRQNPTGDTSSPGLYIAI